MERYALQVTLSGEAKAKLERAQALRRHKLPSGDLAQVIEHALDALLEKEEARKLGKVRKPGRRCDETAFLEFDHVVPVALGGREIVEAAKAERRMEQARRAALEDYARQKGWRCEEDRAPCSPQARRSRATTRMASGDVSMSVEIS